MKVGVSARVLRDTPIDGCALKYEIAEFVNRVLKEEFPRVSPLEWDDYISHTSWTDEQKAEITLAHDALRDGTPSVRDRRKRKAFQKVERYLEYKPPRCIMAPLNSVKAFMGPAIAAVERVVFALEPFIKHVPVPDRPAKIVGLKRAGLRYYSTDFTAFESHFTPEIYGLFECALYRHCLHDWKHVETLCQIVSGWHVIKVNNIKAVVKGRRMSGDMCTSLGNGFTNYMLARFLMERQGCDFSGFVEGDDGIFATSAVLTKELYQQCGFTIKIEEIDDPCRASFCGMICTESAQSIVNPVKWIIGMNWSHTMIYSGDQKQLALLKGKCMSAIYEAPSCPVTSVIARSLLKRLTSLDAIYVDDQYHDRVPVEFRQRTFEQLPAFQPTMDTRALYELEFGVSISSQYLLEESVGKPEFMRIFERVVPVPFKQAVAMNHFAARFIERIVLNCSR